MKGHLPTPKRRYLKEINLIQRVHVGPIKPMRVYLQSSHPMDLTIKYLVYRRAATAGVVRAKQMAIVRILYGCKVNGSSKFEVTPGGGARPG